MSKLYQATGASLRIVKATVLTDTAEEADARIARAWNKLPSFEDQELDGVKFKFDDDDCYDDLESFPSAEPVNLAVRGAEERTFDEEGLRRLVESQHGEMITSRFKLEHENGSQWNVVDTQGVFTFMMGGYEKDMQEYADELNAMTPSELAEHLGDDEEGTSH
jgi:hypothetical protein